MIGAQADRLAPTCPSAYPLGDQAQGGTPMDSTILATFRHDLCTACFMRARNALLDLIDALVNPSTGRSGGAAPSS